MSSPTVQLRSATVAAPKEGAAAAEGVAAAASDAAPAPSAFAARTWKL